MSATITHRAGRSVLPRCPTLRVGKARHTAITRAYAPKIRTPRGRTQRVVKPAGPPRRMLAVPRGIASPAGASSVPQAEPNAPSPTPSGEGAFWARRLKAHERHGPQARTLVETIIARARPPHNPDEHYRSGATRSPASHPRDVKHPVSPVGTAKGLRDLRGPFMLLAVYASPTPEEDVHQTTRYSPVIAGAPLPARS